MNTDLFFEKFDVLAEAPGGVAELRELVLQLAVQGKLVPQDATEEPASRLMDRIRAQRARQVGEGTITERAIEPILQGDEPFTVPSNWVWARLSEIAHDCGQEKPQARFTYIDVGAINKELGVISADVEVLDANEAPSRARKLVSTGSIIFSTVRPYLLNVAVVDKEYEPRPIVSTAFAVLHPFDGVCSRFIYNGPPEG